MLSVCFIVNVNLKETHLCIERIQAAQLETLGDKTRFPKQTLKYLIKINWGI